MSGGFGQFEVVVVRFPFADSTDHRKRPAVIVSGDRALTETGIGVVAMVTRAAAAPWHGDIPIARADQAGLHKPSKLRMKLHSIALDTLEPPIGRLSPPDVKSLRAGLRALLEL